MEDEINIREYLKIIWKRKYLIAFFVLLFASLMAYYSLNKRTVYESKAYVLLKSDSPSAGGLSQLVGLQNLLGGGGGASSNTFPVLLTSRAVAEKVMDDLRLTERIKGWDGKDVKKGDLISAVQGMVKFSDKKGLFEIKATNGDPVVARDVANAYAVAGAEYWKKMNYTEARNKREYIESQLPRVEDGLKKAEAGLKKFSLLASGNSLPSVDLKRRERELLIQNDTYVMLRKEYESSKLDESKELTPFSMIDPAEVPVNPVSNKLSLNILIGVVLGGFVGVFSSFFIEYWEKTGK
jgi:uncharacterized protein involved in exopolysaccharide biosynthesis